MADPNFYSYQPMQSEGSDTVPSFEVYGDTPGTMFMGHDGFNHFNNLSDSTINSAYPPLQTDVVQRGTKRTADEADFEGNSLTGVLEVEHAAKPARKSTKSRRTGKTGGADMEDQKDRMDEAPSQAEVDAAMASAASAEAVGAKQGLYPPIKMNFGHTVPELSLEAELEDWASHVSLSGYSMPLTVPLTVNVSASSEWDLPNAGRMSSLLIYRRNYMTFKVSFAIYPHRPGAHIYVYLPCGERRRVQAFGMVTSAVVADDDMKKVRLIQNTTKRDKGPTNEVKVEKVSPRHPEMQHDSGINPITVPTGDYLLPRNIDGNERPSSPSHTFTRVQFTKATQNNGRTNQPQQLFCIRAELCADISTVSGESDWYRVASAYSERMIVRGRSPGHYNGQDQRAMKTYIREAKDKGEADRLVPNHLQTLADRDFASDSPPPRPSRRQQKAVKRGNRKSSHPATEHVQEGYGTMTGNAMAGMIGIGPQYALPSMNMDEYGGFRGSLLAPGQMGGLGQSGFSLPDDHFGHGPSMAFDQDSHARFWAVRRNIVSMPSTVPHSPVQQDPGATCHEPGHAYDDDDLIGPPYDESIYRPHYYGHHVC